MRKIPISTVKFGSETEKKVLEVLRSGMIAQGKVVAEFEEKFAQLSEVKHAIAVNNGTTSLVASLQALNLQPGDEVITSPFTFIATLNAIIEAGATAVFVDISPDDFCLDPEKVREAITSRTKVIMPVNLYGQMANLIEISQIAKEHGLRVIEDSAQSHGATVEGKKSGSFDIGSFSFYATKNLTTGEGGMITTNDDQIADKLRILRNQGMRARYQYEMAGHNYRLTDLQAALAIEQLDNYESTVSQRRKNASFYSENLQGIPGLKVPQVMQGRTHVWHQYTLQIGKESKLNREVLASGLEDAGISSGFYYPKLVFDYPTYAGRPDIIIHSFENAQLASEESISIPVHQYLVEEDLSYVAETIRKLTS